MKRTRRAGTKSFLIATLACALVASGLSAVGAERKPVKLDYSRAKARERVDRSAAPRKPLPRALQLETRRVDGDESARSPEDRRKGRAQARPTGRLSRQVEIHRHARAAAVWAADTLVDQRGRREYFRVGFYEGMGEALRDPALGRGDHRQGERLGWRDVEARSIGTRTGDDAARFEAERNAEFQVVEQFSDLAARPRYLPLVDRPSFVPTLPLIAEPTLDEVFADFPLDARGREVFLEGWRYDAARLHDCRTYADFFDARWNDADTAFRFWNKRPERSAYFRTLRDAEDRGLFEEKFGEVFVQRVATLLRTELLPAFERGVRRGWSYGASVRQELEYRRGFHAGFVRGLEDSALAGFHATYPRHYEEAYRSTFDDWSRNPKLEIGEVWLSDGNGDGVFAPGEQLLVDAELINFGGGHAHLPLQLDGRVLDQPGYRMIDLPPRSVTRPEGRLHARIARHTPNRTLAALELALAESVRELSLRVSHPLQLRRGAWRVRRSNLDGEVTLEVDVENESTRAVHGRLELTTASLPGKIVARPLGAVESGQVRRLALEVEGLDPLELLAGWVELDVALYGGPAVHDRFSYHIPDAARDLSNRDLLLFMVRLTQEQRDADRVAATRELLMTRLRADWKAAVSRNGNPYKFDYRHDGATTALGDLVQTYRLQDPDVRDHPVFVGLSGDVLTLAERLPGIHPFLRKYVRRLARELP
jgi:hypothetical protein